MNKVGVLVSALLICAAYGQEITCRADTKRGVLTSACSGSEGFRSKLICGGGTCSYSSWFEADPHQGEWDTIRANEEAGYTFVDGKWIKKVPFAYAETTEGCDKECTITGSKPDSTCRKACIERVSKEQQHARLEEQFSAACNDECIFPSMTIPDAFCKNACEAHIAKKLGLADAAEWLQPTIYKRIQRESQNGSSPISK